MATAAKKKNPVQAVIDGLDWHDEGLKKTKNGIMQLMTAISDDRFRLAWKNHRDELRNCGISVAPHNGGWQVRRWMSVEDSVPPVTETHKLKNSQGLLGYQIPHVEKLVAAMRQNRTALDGSETGVGKTVCSLAVARELKLIPFVLAPKSILSSWRRWADYMVVALAGVDTYEKVRMGNTSVVGRISGARKTNFKWNLDPQRNLIIWDEVHKCKSPDSLNSSMLIAARDQGFQILMLSATVAENPMKLKSIGYALRMFSQISFYWRWAESYGCRQVVFGERYRVPMSDPRANKRWLEFIGDSTDPDDQKKGRAHLARLHTAIYQKGRGARIRANDVEGFPENQIVAEAYEMVEAKKIQRIYDDTLERLKVLKENAEGANPLTEILRARQLVEYLKLTTFVELAEDAMEEGRSVVLFVNFEDTLLALAEKLKTDCIIHGGQKAADREAIRERFQLDRSRIIICNIQAGGVGLDLHDLNGKYPRQSFISPTWSAQSMVQALGRIARMGAKSKAVQRIVFAADTVEEDVCAKVQKKIENLNMLNDGDVRPPGKEWN